MTFLYWEKGDNQTFQGVLGTGSELTRILGELKKHRGHSL